MDISKSTKLTNRTVTVALNFPYPYYIIISCQVHITTIVPFLFILLFDLIVNRFSVTRLYIIRIQGKQDTISSILVTSNKMRHYAEFTRNSIRHYAGMRF